MYLTIYTSYGTARPDVRSFRRYSAAPAEEVLDRAARLCGITVAQLRSRTRLSGVSDAQALAATILRARGMSYPQIGRILCRDHASVLSACRRAAVRRDLQTQLRVLRRQLGEEEAS